MKRILLMTAMVLAFGFAASAHDHKTEKNEKTSVTTEKKNSKKKSEICSECGKSEKKCECHEHESEKK